MPMPPRPTRFPWRYLLALGREILGQMALMLVAVEALYLSDKMVTHLLFDTLRNQLGIRFLVETLVLAAPEILSVGFPVAVVIAVYLTLLRRREAGDFVILAGAGVPPRALVGLCLGLGVVAMTVAGGLRGFLEPLAARELAQRLVEGRFEAVQRGRLTDGQFLTIGTTTFYQQPQEDGRDAGARSFVYLAPTQTEEQVITAAQTRLTYSEAETTGLLELDNARIILFTRGEGQSRSVSVQIGVGHMQVGPIPLDLPDFGAMRRLTRTATLPELVAHWLDGESAAGRAALERGLGMALALVAPLLAGLAVAATRGRWRLAALPAALGAVLGGGLAVAPGAALLVTLTPAMAGFWLAAVTALALAAVALVTARLIPGSVLPQRVQL
jgi:lipopolysaccharide export LptBFGC system permease protein LptF